MEWLKIRLIGLYNENNQFHLQVVGTERGTLIHRDNQWLAKRQGDQQVSTNTHERDDHPRQHRAYRKNGTPRGT